MVPSSSLSAKNFTFKSVMLSDRNAVAVISVQHKNGSASTKFPGFIGVEAGSSQRVERSGLECREDPFHHIWWKCSVSTKHIQKTHTQSLTKLTHYSWCLLCIGIMISPTTIGILLWGAHFVKTHMFNKLYFSSFFLSMSYLFMPSHPYVTLNTIPRSKHASLIAEPPELLFAAFLTTAPPNKFPFKSAPPQVLSNIPAKCEIDRLNGCR